MFLSNINKSHTFSPKKYHAERKKKKRHAHIRLNLKRAKRLPCEEGPPVKSKVPVFPELC